LNDKTQKIFTNESKNVKITDFTEMGVFTEDGQFHGKCHFREIVNWLVATNSVMLESEAVYKMSTTGPDVAERLRCFCRKALR